MKGIILQDCQHGNCLFNLRPAWKPFPRKTMLSGHSTSLGITGIPLGHLRVLSAAGPCLLLQTLALRCALESLAFSFCCVLRGRDIPEVVGGREDEGKNAMVPFSLFSKVLISMVFLVGNSQTSTCFDTKLLGLGDGGQSKIFSITCFCSCFIC